MAITKLLAPKNGQRRRSIFGRSSEKVAKPGFRADIQGLRAFAVLAVIADHLFHWPGGGFIGVDVFFVISGFLITGLLLREHEKTGSISFSAFYRNRIRRIAPAATLVLISTVAASWLVFNQTRFESTAADSIWAFLFAANWHYAASGTDYFQASGPESPLQHFWSLAVEEQFYFIWPWLMLLIFVLARRKASWEKKAARRAIGTVMAILTVASFAWALYETEASPTWAYFSTFSRAWELGVGALIAVCAEALTRLGQRARQVLAFAGFAGIVVSLFAVNAAVAFPAPWAALPVLSTALVIISGTGGGDPVRLWPLTNPVAGYIGNISYSLYLWHFPVIILGTALFGDDMWHRAAYAATFTLAAIYAYHLVEDPIRRSGWLTGTKRRHAVERQPTSMAYKLTALSLLGILTASCVGAALHTGTSRPSPAAIPKSIPTATQKAVALPPKLAALQTQIAAATRATEWPKLSPSLEEVMAGRQAADDISDCGGVSYDESACTWGDPKATKTAITVGNSIALTLTGSLRAALGNSDGWNIVSYGMFGCPFANYATAPNEERPAGCKERPDQAVEAINRIKPEVVFVAGTISVENARDQLAKIKIPTKLVFLPTPPFDKDINACYTKLSTPADCVGGFPPNWAQHERILAAATGGIFLDTSPWFCNSGICPSFVGTIPTKMDRVHMSPAYALHIAPIVRESLRVQKIIPLAG